MESHFSFTYNKLKGLSATEKRFFVFDSKQPGLRLYVTPSGIKTFQFQVRSKKLNKIVTRTLGKFPSLQIEEARTQAASLLNEVNSGADIEVNKREDRRQNFLAPSVRDFALEYIEKYAKINKKSWEADQRILEKHVLPVIGRAKMKDISRRDLVSIIDTVADRGSLIMANRIHALLSKFFNFAIERDVVEMSPVHGMKKRTSEQPRTRFLSDNEITELWKWLGLSSSESILKLILITGQRPGEVRKMEWKEIQNNLWIIPSEKSKNGLIHAVPLPPMALEILEKLKSNHHSSSYVFPARTKSGTPASTQCLNQTGPIHAMKKIVTKLNWQIPARPHDLRRTVRSNLSKLGVSQEVAERILNHKENGISATYNQYDYLKEKKAALLLWNDYLLKITPTFVLKANK